MTKNDAQKPSSPDKSKVETDAKPETEEEKIKREQAGPELTVALAANPDIARETGSARKAGSVSVGFALETGDLLANAKKKLESKGFDIVVANDATEAGSGFEVSTNRVTILARGAEAEELPLMSKDDVAEELLDRVDSKFSADLLRIGLFPVVTKYGGSRADL